MRDKFTTIVISLVIMTIIAITVVFGIIILQEFSNTLQTDIDEFEYSQVEERTDTEEKLIDTSKTLEDIETPKIVETNALDKIKSVEPIDNSKNDVDYSNVSVNKYFYSQLEEHSKIIYKAFEANKEKMKTGTQKIELGNSFSNVLSQNNGSKILGQYYQAAIEAYTYDNPDVFYLNPSKMYLNIETTTRGNNKTYNVFINCGNETNYLTDEFENENQVRTAISRVEEIKKQILSNRTGNTYNDIKMVHDYLVDNLSYDDTLSNPYIYNIYGALVRNNCVCEGYARSMKYLLDALNVDCVVVIGKGTNTQGQTENHAWNYVKLSNNWYAIDSTWDDPVIIGGGNPGDRYKYKYFLKGINTMSIDHTSSGQFTEDGKTFDYPKLSISDFNG